MTGKHCFWPAEWHPQSAVQITWPDQHTDWVRTLPEVVRCCQAIAAEIAGRQKLVVVCRNSGTTRRCLEGLPKENLVFIEAPLNDTWARDHGPLTVICAGKPVLLDFQFNGWGLKYPAHHDNLITRRIYASGLLQTDVAYRNHLDFVLEGGSVESDGQGTILTTARCLLSPNRNGGCGQEEIEHRLTEYLHADRVLWLHNGHLAGDDTDGHIDTLARFCSPDTIAYVRCDDPDDDHFAPLKAMEEELRSFRTSGGRAYNLAPLPMAEPLFDAAGNRLPATYANFLIINGAVLVPCYGSPKDERALQVVQSLFKHRKAVGIDCRPLIEQHGSLHCMAMQYPDGVIR